MNLQHTLPKLKSEISRRILMQSIAATTMGVSMAARPAFTAESSSSRLKVVRIFLNGGLSHMDSFDPKPQSPDLMGATQTIKGNTGENISAYFPETAKRMDRLAVIRSMVSPEGDHERSVYLQQTSYKLIGTIKHPNMGAWMQAQKGALNETLPPSVSINDPYGAGFLGTTYEPFAVNRADQALKGLVMDNPTSSESIELLKLMADVRRDFHKENSLGGADAYRRYYNDAIKLMQSKDLSAFDLESEDPALRKKFNVRWGNEFLLARKLIEADVQFVSLNLGGWDSHLNLWDNDQFPTLAGNFDKAFNLFLDDMEARGHLKNTIVSVSTDFGRTPVIDTVRKGRNHHRKAFCTLMAGAGVKTGIVYGQTDDRATEVVDKPVDPIEFNATIAKLAGLDLKKEIYSADNRPFTICRGGEPVPGLMA